MSTWTMHHYTYIHTEYMHTYISTVIIWYMYSFVSAHPGIIYCMSQTTTYLHQHQFRATVIFPLTSRKCIIIQT